MWDGELRMKYEGWILLYQLYLCILETLTGIKINEYVSFPKSDIKPSLNV